ncbi:MAG: helix-turn-helix domain-containing protein [Chitinispirillaceae bacterium]|nr:helix-turn-helix domain-containing protein [Chitinispirillaceae bacterium]
MNTKTFFPIALAASVLSAAAATVSLDKCVLFKAPDQKSVITIPVCTLGVGSTCKEIEQVEIRARYCPFDADTLVERVIGTITAPPFLKVWDLSRIPNQLTFGVGILIIVNFADGDAYGLHREGIFLAHRPIYYPPANQVSYEYYGTQEFAADTVRLISSKTGATAFARMFWCEKGITFSVSVRDTLFDSSASQKILEQRGIEILIDPSKKKSFYPDDNIMRLAVPLAGKPFLVVYQPVFKDQRTYQLKQSITPVNVDCSIRSQHRGGFTVTVAVPRYLFRTSLPREANYNIIVKTSQNSVSSLVNVSSGFNHYSPLLWPSLTLLPKPVFKTRWLILLSSFLAGLLLSLFGYAGFTALTKDRPRVILTRCPDTEKHAFEKIKEALDRHVTRKGLSLDVFGPEVNMPARQLETAVKKATGLSFTKYVMYLRTEIVCERLRSSFSSEASIAESCGFRSVKEMGRWFRRFYHMTPQTFRKEKQVIQTK